MSASMEAAWKAINTLRVLCADVVQNANSGHPGAPMGMAPMAYTLWNKVLKYNPSNYAWPNRDRFVLSNGHACALQYSMLYLTGYKEWSMADLKAFRQMDSKTPGHPENCYPGIEVSTGPLGQGLSNAVGLAIGEAHMAARFNRPGLNVVDHYTFVFCGDGCLQEGITSEASSLAGHLGLGKLICLYDDNHITIDGETELSFTEDVLRRYEAYGWHTQHVADGDNDLDGIYAAIQRAKEVKDKPSLIKVTTTIGFGSKKQGTEAVHGSPLGKDDLVQVKKKFGFDPDKSFLVDPDVAAVYNHVAQGEAAEQEWRELFDRYAAQFPDLAAEFRRRIAGELPANWQSVLPKFDDKTPPTATRKLSQACIQAMSKVLPEFFGGSADLNPSTFTYLENSKDFEKGEFHNRNVRFGVREHGMAAICNGLAAYGGYIPFCSTFLNFIGYALGAVTLSALSHFRVIYIMTHDSIGLGEDGPTHQAIEKFMLCRITPNILFLRPGDGVETAASYALAIENKHRPTVLALSRQNVPGLAGTSAEGVAKGAYVLSDAAAPDIILVGTGSELNLCVDAKKKLTDLQVRVVSMPSWELFDDQSQQYKESVFLPGVPVMSVEAGITTGWERYAHTSIGMQSFGASAPYQEVYKKFGITTDNIVEKSRVTVSFYKENACPSLVRRAFSNVVNPTKTAKL